MRPIGRLTPPCSAGKPVRALMRLSRRPSSMTRVARLARSGEATAAVAGPAFLAPRAGTETVPMPGVPTRAAPDVPFVAPSPAQITEPVLRDTPPLGLYQVPARRTEG